MYIDVDDSNYGCYDDPRLGSDVECPHCLSSNTSFVEFDPDNGCEIHICHDCQKEFKLT